MQEKSKSRLYLKYVIVSGAINHSYFFSFFPYRFVALVFDDAAQDDLAAHDDRLVLRALLQIDEGHAHRRMATPPTRPAHVGGVAGVLVVVVIGLPLLGADLLVVGGAEGGGAVALALRVDAARGRA